MTTLVVSVTTDYSAGLPGGLTGVDAIDFDNAALTSATATFRNTQFTDGAILMNVQWFGSPGTSQIGVGGGSLDAALWTFGDWNAGDRIVLNGSGSADTISGSSQSDTISGDNGNDALNGGPGGHDSIAGGAGDDTLIGDVWSLGDDTLIGGAGDDSIYGNDLISQWQGGADVYIASGAADGHENISDVETLDYSALGPDNAIGTRFFRGISFFYVIDIAGGDSDAVNAYWGAGRFPLDFVKRFYSGAGDDTLNGIAFADFGLTEGGAGDDSITGALHATLRGQNGNDTLIGVGGNDTLEGGVGNDSLKGTAGADSLDGGGGRDVAAFSYASTSAVFSRGAAWSWNIANGGETDNLYRVEVARFTDRDVALREAPRSDVTGDGASDLVWHDAVNGFVSFYEIDPAGGYVWRNIGTVTPGHEAFTGDFNGDGEADILFFDGSRISWYDVDPTIGYVWRDIGAVTPGHQAIIGDFDGDGVSDAAFLNAATGRLSWYDIDPGGGYVWRDIGTVTPGYAALAGDFNGDGRTDIGFFDGTHLGYADIDPAGGYVWRDIGTVAPGYAALAGDFNNDGTTDVAFINRTTNAISFYAVNPSGGYTWRNIGAVAPGYTATAADVTNDGKTDIVFTGNGTVNYYDVGPTGGYTWHNIGAVGAGYLLVG